MALITFPEQDKCLVGCVDSGGFKRTSQNFKQIVKRSRIDNPKNLEEKDNNVEIQEILEKAKILSQVPNHTGDHLEQCKPQSSGNVDWTPLAWLTGTRPTVTKYSLSRFSLNEWKNHNLAVLDDREIRESNVSSYNGQTAIMSAFGNIDKFQLNNNQRLKQRAKDIFKWKVEVEVACKAITEEVQLLQNERQRVNRAFKSLMLPESISKECLELRSNRAAVDLVLDQPEQELRKELDLVSEVKDAFKSMLQKIDDQLTINKAAKHKIEYDWSNKKEAYNTEATNLALNPKSNVLMFRFGATKFGNYSAPLNYWEYFCRDSIENVEAVRQASADLRSTVNGILMGNGTKLREQADKTDKAFKETVNLTHELVTMMEEHLKSTLHALADTELLILNLHNSIRKTDTAMKLAQTRLDNRNNGRPKEENVRDQAHVGIIHEVKMIHETVTGLLGQLNAAEETRKNLMKKRREIEADIASKRKTINIDNDRCSMIRSYYPSVSELAGL